MQRLQVSCLVQEGSAAAAAVMTDVLIDIQLPTNLFFSLSTGSRDLETATLVHTIINTADKPEDIKAFNFASQALNNAFFLSGIVSQAASLAVANGRTTRSPRFNSCPYPHFSRFLHLEFHKTSRTT